MKKITLAVVFVMVLAVLVCGCEANAVTRYDYNMKKYVTLPEEISADIAKGEKFDAFFEEYVESAVMSDGISTESTVAKASKGNVVGITVTGETVVKEQLELIAGDTTFKYGDVAKKVIGKKAGDSFDYVYEIGGGAQSNLTVTVDYVRIYELNDSVAQLMGYSDEKDAEQKLKDAAKDEFIINSLVENSEIKDYPEDEYTELYEAKKNYYAQLASGYGNSLDEYLKKEDITQKEFDVMLDEQVKEAMKKEMPLYAIARAEKIKLTKADINKKAEEIAKQNGGTMTAVFEQTPLRDIEALAVKDAVIKVIKEESKKK